MKKMIESITGGYVSSAKVVDGALILSLPDAISPVVWRMDLSSVKSSALEVRDQKDGTFMLTLKTPRDDVTNIAPFTDKAVAVRALMAVSHALETGHGNIIKTASSSAMSGGEISQPRYNPPAAPVDGGMAKWVSGIAAVLVLFVLIGVLAHQTPSSRSFNGTSPGTGATASAVPSSSGSGSGRNPMTAIAPETNATGVPVSADDFLRENK